MSILDRREKDNMADIVLTTKWTWQQISEYWPDISAAIEKYVRRFSSECTYDDLIDYIITGRKDLWIVIDKGKFLAFILTEKVYTVDGKQRLIISDMGGKLGNYLQQGVEYIEKYAKEQHIDKVQIIGRLGWKSLLQSNGYNICMIDYRKDITHGVQ